VSNKKPRLRAEEEGEDWGGGEKEGRVGDFRELDRSANKHEFSLGWVLISHPANGRRLS
jgi:hypothetical protein